MSLVEQEGNHPVHFPSNPNRFEFDSEVSRIFPDMARRSIPNFYEAHAAHAAMLEPWLVRNQDARILDVGASRGAFFQALRNQYGCLPWTLHAIDNSEPMCQYLRDEYPRAQVTNMDVSAYVGAGNRIAKDGDYDVVCVNYVIQFLPPAMQWQVLLHLFRLVRPGGVFIFGHKATHRGMAGTLAHEEYIKFRMSHGYTREEIEAKTRALKGAMHTMDHTSVLASFREHFSDVQETFRFMMFCTIFAVK